jgi:hypothetical protein
VTSTARVIGIPAGRRILSYFFGSAKKWETKNGQLDH